MLIAGNVRRCPVTCIIPRSVKRDDIQFPAKHSALRDDVHVLGALVGDVLKEQGGDAFIELVEKDRRLSIKRRAGDKEAAAELHVQLRSKSHWSGGNQYAIPGVDTCSPGMGVA